MKFKLKKFDIPLKVTHIANIHYFEFTDDYYTRDDSHSFCELVYVDKGEIFVHSDNYSGILKSGELIIHLPDETHSLSCMEGAPNIIIIGFKCEATELEKFCHGAYDTTTEQKRMLAELLREGMSVFAPPYDTPNLTDMKKRQSYPFGADQMIKLRLEMFLISLIRMYSDENMPSKVVAESHAPVEDIKRYVDEHFTENIQLDNICFIFGTNKTTLCKKFKNEYGVTVLKYINNLKIREAKRLLRQNKLSVTQISDKLGFTSIHYFCKFFKKTTGESPVSYSKSIRSKLDI